MAEFVQRGPAGRLKFRADARYDAVRFIVPSALAGDRRFVTSNGTIALNNRVMFKADASAPEQPMAGARVRLHRLADGYCAWQGTSDAQGYYHASGLEVGLKYVPIAIDLTGTYECVAAGPVVAVEPAP
ncbi:MAG: hypothetical protein WA917_13585 [Comamonas sp.]